MINRGMVKWQPFDSLFPSKKTVDAIIKEREKKQKKILSIEQIEDVEEKLKEAFYDHSPITVIYYKNENYFKKKGTIIKIDSVSKKIYFEDQSYLYFKQIIRIDS